MYGGGGGGGGALAALAARQTVDAQRVGSPLQGRGHVYTGTALQFTVGTVSQKHPTSPLPLPQVAINSMPCTHEKKKKLLYLGSGIFSPPFIASRKKCFLDTCSGNGDENKSVEPMPGLRV